MLVPALRLKRRLAQCPAWLSSNVLTLLYCVLGAKLGEGLTASVVPYDDKWRLCIHINEPYFNYSPASRIV